MRQEMGPGTGTGTGGQRPPPPPSNTSRSTPAGAKPYDVYLLDGHPIQVTVSRKAKGEELLQEVFNSMNPPLEERDYFSLTFDVLDEKEPTQWLDRSKSVERQMKNAANPAFAMNVKFYPPDPTSLMEYTRYLFYLQIRDDVAKGKLPCSLATQALLGSFVCQADIGDYTPDMDLSAVQELPLCAPDVLVEDQSLLLERILGLYRTHRGMTTAEAEQAYLEVAKKLTMYGVTTKQCSDVAGIKLKLGVSASGVLVFRDQLRLNRFAWAKVIKISYKKNDFSVTVTPGDYEKIDKVIVFKMDSQKEAKTFWKICIEHHQFFRLYSANPKPRKIIGSSHPTLCGQTEYQIKKSATMNRGDTFARNSFTYRKTQTLPSGGLTDRSQIKAPPSPQSGEYEPRRHEPQRVRNGTMPNTENNAANMYVAQDVNSHFSPNMPPGVGPDGGPIVHTSTHQQVMPDPRYPNNQNIAASTEVQHATITTTVRTSIRMPPNHPPPRTSDPASSPPSAHEPHMNGGGEADPTSANGDVTPVDPASTNHHAGQTEESDDDELAAPLPSGGSVETEYHLERSEVRTASIMFQTNTAASPA